MLKLTHFLCIALASATACQSPANPPAQPAPAPVVTPAPATSLPQIVVSRNGITLDGKPVLLDSLSLALQVALKQQPTLPSEIPVRYEGEVLMGMRGEVYTEVRAALEAAAAARQKQ